MSSTEITNMGHGQKPAFSPNTEAEGAKYTWPQSRPSCTVCSLTAAPTAVRMLRFFKYKFLFKFSEEKAIKVQEAHRYHYIFLR